MTPKQLRSAAHALRTAANALEDVTTQLRTLATEIDTPDDLNDPEPDPWPSAPYVWHDGQVWMRVGGGDYYVPSDYWSAEHLNATADSIRDGALGFAREAVPVTLVPTEAWQAWETAKAQRLDELEESDAMLMDAVDALTGGER